MIKLLGLLASVAITVSQAQASPEQVTGVNDLNARIEMYQTSIADSLIPSEFRAFAELSAIYQTQMQYALLVLERSSNQTVRQYAYNVYRQYYYANYELTYMASSMGMPLVNFPTTTEELEGLWSQAQKFIQLSILSGRQLDERYIALQVESHRGALNTIESHLASTTNEYAKRYLEQAKETVGQYYEEAQKLQAGLY